MILIICPLIFLSGFIDSIAGGGGLISLPAFTALGLPPKMVLGCNKFSAVWGTMISTFNFFKSKKIHKETILISVVSSLIGSWLGTNLALIIEDIYLKYFLIVMLPLIAIFILTRKDFGEPKPNNFSSKKILILAGIASFFIGGYDGFFGPGTGTFLILVFTSVLGFDIVTASGNAKVINLSSNIASCVVLIYHGEVYYTIAIPAAIFGILGNYIGSKLAINKGKKIIKPIFVVVLGLLLSSIVYNLLKSS